MVSASPLTASLDKNSTKASASTFAEEDSREMPTESVSENHAERDSSWKTESASELAALDHSL